MEIHDEDKDDNNDYAEMNDSAFYTQVTSMTDKHHHVPATISDSSVYGHTTKTVENRSQHSRTASSKAAAVAAMIAEWFPAPATNDEDETSVTSNDDASRQMHADSETDDADGNTAYVAQWFRRGQTDFSLP